MMKGPSIPFPWVLATIFTSGIGFMLIGSWVSELNIDKYILWIMGASFIALAIIFAYLSTSAASVKIAAEIIIIGHMIRDDKEHLKKK